MSNDEIPAFRHRRELASYVHRIAKGIDLDANFRNDPLDGMSEDVFEKKKEITNILVLRGLKERVHSAEVVLWRPDLFEAASYGSELMVGEIMPDFWIPPTIQIWQIEGRNTPAWNQITTRIFNDSVGKWHLKSIVVMPVFGRSGQSLVNITDPEQIKKFQTLNTDPPLDADDTGPINLNVTLKGSGSKVDLFFAICVFANGADLKMHFCLIENDVPLEAIDYAYAPIIAALGFMTQEFITTRRTHCGKRINIGGVKHQSSYQTVVLRERHMGDNRMKSVRNGEDVVWSCCWGVRGHWRKLKQPRKSDGATMTYVSPFVKGDTSKGMKMPKDRLIRVRR